MNFKEMPEYHSQLEIAQKYADSHDVSTAINQIDDIILDSIKTLKAAENAPALRSVVNGFRDQPEVRKDLINYSNNLIAVLLAAVSAELTNQKQASNA